MPEQIGEQLPYSVIGYELEYAQIYYDRFQVTTVLYRILHIGRKPGSVITLAMGALFVLGAVFRHNDL
jgi:hypothetical protein